VCGSGHDGEGLRRISALTTGTDFKARRYRIAAQGATIQYLPPYSPDLNPIEQVFAKLKALLRKAAERTYEMLWRMVGQLMDRFQADECLNFFRHSGYLLVGKITALV
jgi:transposase